MGINCWQSGHGNYALYRRFLEEGGKMHFLAIEAGKGDAIQKLSTGGCIGIAHHGEVTDALFKAGRLDEIHDFLKRVHDAGLLAGVSTHMPAVVDAIESKGWDFDYYMTCVYERHRSEQELKKLLGMVPLPPHEVYLVEDPPRMFQAIRSTKRPCRPQDPRRRTPLRSPDLVERRSARRTPRSSRPTASSSASTTATPTSRVKTLLSCAGMVDKGLAIRD